MSNTVNPANVAVYYSNELGDIEKHEGLSSWLSGDSDVLVATKSAGLGLDKSDVKFVIDADMPNSLEELSQHVGRAGRNRQISSTYLFFYREENKSIHVNHISETENVKVQLTKMKKLAKVIEFATLMTCRQSFLLTYFGNIEAIPCQTSCDNCLSPPKVESLVITNDAKNLLKIVGAVGNLGIVHHRPWLPKHSLVL